MISSGTFKQLLISCFHFGQKTALFESYYGIFLNLMAYFFLHIIFKKKSHFTIGPTRGVHFRGSFGGVEVKKLGSTGSFIEVTKL